MASAEISVSVLVVTYRNPDLTRDCLLSLQREVGNSRCEVLLIDNHSEDGTLEMVSREFPWITVVPNGENLGFARANNVLARHARGEFLLLLNPDTVVHAGMLHGLRSVAEQYPGAGLYCGRTVTPAGVLDPVNVAGSMSLWSLFCFATGLSTVFKRHASFNPEGLGGWERDIVRPVDVAAGCLLMVRRDVWEQLGGFDTTFWMYGEDLDLAIRARDRGYAIVFTPHATVTHIVGASSPAGTKTPLVLNSKVRIMYKHWSRARRRFGVALLLLGCGVRALAASAGSGWRETWRRRAEWAQVRTDESEVSQGAAR